MVGHRLSHYWEVAGEMEPTEERGLPRRTRTVRRAQTSTVLALMDFDGWLIGRFASSRPALWPLETWPWARDLEAAWPDIAEELAQYLAGGGGIPHVSEAIGLDPDDPEVLEALPVDHGEWRSLPMLLARRWTDVAEAFPRTRAAMAPANGLAAGFSALPAHSALRNHVDPHRGLLRFQLPVVVPEGAGDDCANRIGGEVLPWQLGKAIVFDPSQEHEAWNDTDGLRVLLMVEVPLPLPLPLRLVNRVTLRSYRWFPSQRRASYSQAPPATVAAAGAAR